MGKAFPVPQQGPALAAKMVLIWIENLASHMAERDKKVWQTCIMVKKKN